MDETASDIEASKIDIESVANIRSRVEKTLELLRDPQPRSEALPNSDGAKESDLDSDFLSILDVEVPRHQYTPRKLINELTRPTRQFVLAVEKPDHILNWSKSEVRREVVVIVSHWREQDQYGSSYFRYHGGRRSRTATPVFLPTSSREATPDLGVQDKRAPEEGGSVTGSSKIEGVSATPEKDQTIGTEKPDTTVAGSSMALEQTGNGMAANVAANEIANGTGNGASGHSLVQAVGVIAATPVTLPTETLNNTEELDDWGDFESTMSMETSRDMSVEIPAEVPEETPVAVAPTPASGPAPDLKSSRVAGSVTTDQTHTVSSSTTTDAPKVHISHIGPYSTPAHQVKRLEDAKVDEIVSQLPDLSFMLGS